MSTADQKTAGRDANRRWRANNPEKAAAARSRGKAKMGPERRSVYQQAWVKKNPDYWKTYHYRKTYGLTVTDIERMLVEQGGACAICKMIFSQAPQVDHNHTTGKVRGLLCNHCNRGLGSFRDDISALTVAIEYLNKSRD